MGGLLSNALSEWMFRSRFETGPLPRTRRSPVATRPIGHTRHRDGRSRCGRVGRSNVARLWNTLVKVAHDGYLATVLIAGGGAVMCAIALPFLPPMNSAAWINVAGSVVMQSIYYPLVAAAYRAGDMSQTYPLMRGTAPLLVAIVSAPLLGEQLTGGQWLGVALICCGIWGIGRGPVLGRPGRGLPAPAGRSWLHIPKATVLALITAAVIACYTLID